MLGKFARLLKGLEDFRLQREMQRTEFMSGLGNSSYLLYGLVRSMKPAVCVEIGSARGRSACFIGRALKENGSGRLFAIDPHVSTNWNDNASVETLPILESNLRKFQLESQVQIVRKTSIEAANDWNSPIDMIFIDGDHSYEGVKQDWELFVPHVKEFGVVVFHDTIWDRRPDSQWSRKDMGVPRFVDELRQNRFPIITIDRDYGVTLVQPTVGGVPLSQQTPAKFS